MQRPFGLPKTMTVAEYRASPICYLSAWNYKVEALVGPTAETQVEQLTVIDTGAGPNLIRADLLPDEALLKLDQSREMVNLASASNHRLQVMGITMLSVTIANHKARQQFIVVKRLGADVILGCTYIDAHINAIRPRQKVIELRNESIVPIRRRPHQVLLDRGTRECKKVAPVKKEEGHVRVAQRIVLAPESETNVLVSCSRTGTCFTETNDDLYNKKSLAMANGIVDIRKGIPFIVRVANFSPYERVLVKRQIIGVAVQAPEQVLAIDFDSAGNVPATGTAENVAKELPPVPSTFEKGEGLGAALGATGAHGVHARTTPESFSVNDVDLDHLDSEIQARVRKMLRDFSGMWQGQLGTIKVTEHRINVKDESDVVHCQPHRAGPKSRKLQQEEVDTMLDQDVIEPAASEWASPVVIVPKSDGNWRFCVDYRKLNSITVKDSYPLPRMDECIDSLGDAKYFSTLDCNSGFWQIPIREEDRDKTTFTCHAGTYRFKKMPFGLCNAPATFQRTLDIILARYRWKSCLIYLDDIIVFSKTIKDHIGHVRDVLTALQNAGASLKLKKCSFFTQSVQYLGHVIRPGRLEMANTNADAIQGFKEPTTQSELRSFLGLCNVYRRFVPNFSRAAAPLNKLLTKEYHADLGLFSDEERNAFQLLKTALVSPPILRLPRDGLPYSVDTDACKYQVGCALLQTYPDGKRYPIGFWSRSLTSAERNYSVGERECLAVIWAVQLLRPYLERTHFQLYTDHQALRWMFNMADGSSRLARWRLRLLEFDYEIQYKTGATNTIADAISRLPTFGESTFKPDLEIPCFSVEAPAEDVKQNRDANVLLNGCDVQEYDSDHDEEDFIDERFPYEVLAVSEEVELSPIRLETFVQEQTKDDFCNGILSKLESEDSVIYKVNDKGLLVRVSPVDKSEQIVVPLTLRQKVLHLSHFPRMMGHPGGTRMYHTLRRAYYWPSMAVDVYATVRMCTSCAKERVTLRKHKSFMKLFPATAPLEFVAIDILGPLRKTASGNEYLLVMTDRFSKLTRTAPLSSITSYTVAKAFCDVWVFTYGPPVYLLSDNGGQFTSKYFQSICQILGTRNLFTSSYHPQTNGQAERFNRTLLSALRRYVAEELNDWDKFSDAITYGYNTQVHRSTGLSPFDLVLSRTPVHLSLENTPSLSAETLTPNQHRTRFRKRLRELMTFAMKKIKMAQAKYKIDFDRHVLPPADEIVVGSLVFLLREAPVKGSRNKLSSKVTGPFKVLKRSSHTVTIINAHGNEDTVSLDRVTFAPSTAEELSSEPLREEGTAVLGEDIERHSPKDGEDFVFDKIVDYDQEENRFRVRWEGYRAKDDTWEPVRNVPYNAVRAFFRRKRRPFPEQVRLDLPPHLQEASTR